VEQRVNINSVRHMTSLGQF